MKNLLLDHQGNNRVVYCTIFDDQYLVRALTLYRSFIKVNKQSTFSFFCIDSFSFHFLTALKLDRAIIVSHTDFATLELLEVKDRRSPGEYSWTCKPVAILYLMNLLPPKSWVVYVDTDMMFFGDPDEILPKFQFDFLLTPHRFHANFLKSEISVGKYNAGYIAARCSDRGKSAITWWKVRCLESCSFIPTANTFADQKYLNQMMNFFKFGASIDHIGMNAAPWNMEKFDFTYKNNRVFIDKKPLLLFHFQGLHLFDNGIASLYVGNLRINKQLLMYVYMPYILALMQEFKIIREVDPHFRKGLRKQRNFLGNFFKRFLGIILKRSNIVSFKVL
jgi:hypothetical protein